MSTWAWSKIRSRLGVTMIETAMVMIIAAAALAAGASLYSSHLDNMAKRATADQIKRVSKAFGKYLEDNHATLLPQVQAAGGRMNVSVEALKPDYLSDEFENQSPFNQRFVFTLRKPAASDLLEGLIHTETISADYPMRTGDALEVARLVGATAGYTDPIDPQNVISSYGQFDIDLADYGVNPGTGSIVSSITVSGSIDAGYKYLHRNAMPDPSLNRMNTALNMGGNAIDSASTVTASGQVRAGNVVSASTISAGSSISAGSTITAGSTISTPGAVNSGSLNTGPITASSANVSGNVTANAMYANNGFNSYGTSGWQNLTYGGGWYMQDSQWIRASGGKSVHTSGTLQAGEVVSTGNANIAGTTITNQMLTNYVSVYGTATTGHINTLSLESTGNVTANSFVATAHVGIGGACYPGQVARTGSSTVTCVNGRWTAGGGGGFRVCASHCGGAYPVHIGGPTRTGDWHGWYMLGPGCTGGIAHYGPEEWNPQAVFCSAN